MLNLLRLPVHCRSAVVYPILANLRALSTIPPVRASLRLDDLRDNPGAVRDVSWRIFEPRDLCIS
jgi:hypothetical protein